MLSTWISRWHQGVPYCDNSVAVTASVACKMAATRALGGCLIAAIVDSAQSPYASTAGKYETTSFLLSL